jgi:hypothetical protein
MPDLDGGQLSMADLAKSKAYFGDLCKIFKLQIVANGAKNPLLLLPLPEIPTSADERQITRTWATNIGTQILASQLKEKDKSLHLSYMSRISRFSVKGWTKAACLAAYEFLKNSGLSALLCDSAKTMLFRPGCYLRHKQVAGCGDRHLRLERVSRFSIPTPSQQSWLKLLLSAVLPLLHLGSSRPRRPCTSR